MDMKPPLVLDIGSRTIKAGFAGDDAPTSTSLNIVGRRLYNFAAGMNSDKEVYVGSWAASRTAVLDLSHPVERGIVLDWDDMEKVLSNTFDDDLSITDDLDERPMLCTEAPLNPRANREKLAQIMFEKFKLPALFVAIPGVLSLHATGRETGIVLDSGHGVTYVVPVHEGYVIPGAICRLDIGGSDITDLLVDYMDKKCDSLTLNSKWEIVRNMKERLGYVALDYKAELRAAAKSTSRIERCYKLPDGQEVKLDVEQFKCTEVLFDPSLIMTTSTKAPGVHELVYHSLEKWDEDDAVRRALYNNIVLTGGSTMFEGFSERLSKEITKFVPRIVKVEEVPLRAREYAAWVGGSIVASLSTFPQMCISSEEYDEYGPSIICKNTKCPWIEPSAAF